MTMTDGDQDGRTKLRKDGQIDRRTLRKGLPFPRQKPLPWKADMYSGLLKRMLDPRTPDSERRAARIVAREIIGGRPNRGHRTEGEHDEKIADSKTFGDLIREALIHRIEGE